MQNELMLSPQEMAQQLGGYREMWGDLGKVLADIDDVGNYLPDGSAHAYAPAVLDRLGHLIQHPGLMHHQGHGYFHSIQRLLHHLHGVVARNHELQVEKELWHTKGNVVTSVQWQNVATTSLSTTATLKAPYSGVNYMILDILMASEVTPLGWLTNLSFAGINFANPSQNSVTYGAPGNSGSPTQQGMGFAVFYTNKTAPEGCRGFQPWTGWILSSDAQIFLQWFNPDPSFTRSISLDFVMRSSPCGNAWGGAFEGKTVGWHVSRGFHNAVDQINSLIFGLSGMNQGPPLMDGAPDWTAGGGHHYPSGGSFFPSGHSGPAGVPMMGAGHHGIRG